MVCVGRRVNFRVGFARKNEQISWNCNLFNEEFLTKRFLGLFTSLSQKCKKDKVNQIVKWVKCFSFFLFFTLIINLLLFTNTFIQLNELTSSLNEGCLAVRVLGTHKLFFPKCLIVFAQSPRKTTLPVVTSTLCSLGRWRDSLDKRGQSNYSHFLWLFQVF